MRRLVFLQEGTLSIVPPVLGVSAAGPAGDGDMPFARRARPFTIDGTAQPPETQRMSRLSRIKHLAGLLEKATILLALGALLYRATVYWRLSAGPEQSAGPGEWIDLGLALLLFLVSLACASTGVAISMLGGKSDKPLAYRAFFIGVLSFLGYDLIHPYIPRLL